MNQFSQLVRCLPKCDKLQGGIRLQQVRSVFWGHDTLEDQMERKRKAQGKKVITWTKPGDALEEKKEYVWAPARIESEAEYSNSLVRNLMNTTEWYAWVTKKQNFFPAWYNYLFHRNDYIEKLRKDYYAYLVESQVFIRQRLLVLGPDLAAAHFLCHNNCRVRFRGKKEWTELDKNGNLDIPATFIKGWHVEAIDCSSSKIIYEGLQNLRNLHHIKYLDVSYCEYFDVFCMDRVSGEYGETLEYLNVSGCQNLDWNGLEVIWKFRNLKTLVIKDMDHVKDLTLICLLILDVMPKLKIVGAEYIDPKLLEGTEHEHLLLDYDGIPRLEPGGSTTATDKKDSAAN